MNEKKIKRTLIFVVFRTTEGLHGFVTRRLLLQPCTAMHYNKLTHFWIPSSDNSTATHKRPAQTLTPSHINKKQQTRLQDKRIASKDQIQQHIHSLPVS